MRKKITRRTIISDTKGGAESAFDSSVPLSNELHTDNLRLNSLHPNTVVARVLGNRNIFDISMLDYSLRNLLPPDRLGDLEKALIILYGALEQQKKVCIVGDFDADGATSTALCIRALTAMGLQNCSFIVPNRFEFGYGLTPEIVQIALGHAPDILLTVDNGISSIEGVKAAKAAGLSVLITDHHLPGKHLPEADAIVNPNQIVCDFESKNLAGVGVVFYLLSALRTHLREKAWFTENNISEPNMADYLDLVALGTVADVVALDRNNRILVSQGLKRIRAGQCCPAVKALLHIAGKNSETTTASDLGFSIGPRLNAAGRLDDMSLGIQCLLSDSVYEAEKLARELDDLNKERRSIESVMQTEALALLETWAQSEDIQNKFGICLYDANWHEGVIGILASRIKERLHRPTIIFALTQTGELKGSGRSIAGVHLRDVLDEVATQHPDILDKFGGHAMAAGLTLNRAKLGDFIEAFDEVVKNKLGGVHPEAEVLSDGELLPEELSLSTAIDLRSSGPWGQGFPEPVFDGEFFVLQQRLLKDKHLKLLVTPDEYSGYALDAIAFNVDTSVWPNEKHQKIHMVYKLEVNEFRGDVKAQLLVDELEVL